jgi:hypothetical protein
MFVDTVVLTGTIVLEGVAFHWSVTTDQRLAVSHERLGTKVEPLVGRPQIQARDMGRAILAGEVSVPDVDAADDLAAPKKP